jgi:hypothetical protein
MPAFCHHPISSPHFASRSRVGLRPAATRRVAQLRSASGQEDVRAVANSHVRAAYTHGDQD